MTKKKKKWRSFQEFLYILPFLAIVLIFAYYPLYGWVYAFFDYKPPQALTPDKFVGLKWFKYMVENQVKVKQLLHKYQLNLSPLQGSIVV